MSDKKVQIIQAAIRLFAIEGAGVATAKIAKEAGVSNGTLFNHFESKQVLFDEVFLHIKIVMAQEVMDSVDVTLPLREMILQAWLAYASWSRANLTELAALNLLKTSQLLSESALNKRINFFPEIIQKTRQAMSDGEITELPIEVFNQMGESILASTLEYARTNDIPMPETLALVEKCFGVFWQGLTATDKHYKND